MQDALTLSVHRSACPQEEGLHLGTLCPAHSAVSHVRDPWEACVPPSGCSPPAATGRWLGLCCSLPARRAREFPDCLPTAYSQTLPCPPWLSDPEGLSQLLAGTQRHCSFQKNPWSWRLQPPQSASLTLLGVSLPRTLLSTCTALANPSSSLLEGQGLTPASVASGQLCRVPTFSSAGWAPGSRPRDLETPASQLPNTCNLVLERRP